METHSVGEDSCDTQFQSQSPSHSDEDVNRVHLFEVSAHIFVSIKISYSVNIVISFILIYRIRIM